MVQIGDAQILLVNVLGSYHAISGVCSHAHALLSMGQLYGDEVVCPLHGSVFNVRTGAVLSPPARENLAVYPVRIEGDDIFIGPDQA